MKMALLVLCLSFPAFADGTNSEIIRQFFQKYSEGKAAEAFSLVATDVKWWVPESLPFGGNFDKRGYLTKVLPRFRGFDGGLKLTVHELLVEGDSIAAKVESLGTHRCGNPQPFRYNNKYHFKFTLRNGLIVEVKEYMDTHHLFELYTLMETEDCKKLLAK